MAYIPSAQVHPGQVIARILEREGMSQKNLGARTGLTEKHLSQMINGDASITIETALLLENALGGTASFWINLEKNYQEAKAREERSSLRAREVVLLDLFPYAELVKRRLVEKTRDLEKRVESLWKFFGVNSLNYVAATEPVAYRKRESVNVKSEYIAAWLRCGELASKEIEVEAFSSATLKKSLDALRSLTTSAPALYSVRVRDILKEAGVRIIYVPHFPGAGVSGAVRWVGENPLIQLSLLYRYADIFWFNLFHEIGHILLHGKKDKFIEFDKMELRAEQEKEQEANDFASDLLIPQKAYSQFRERGDFSKSSIIVFSKSIDIDPGIVEGRLCFDHPALYSKQMGLRTKLEFVENKNPSS